MQSIFKLRPQDSQTECILKALMVPDIVLKSQYLVNTILMLPYPGHVGTIQLKGMGTVGIANDSNQIIQGPPEPDVQQTYP